MKKIFAANWKMYKNCQQSAAAAAELLELVKKSSPAGDAQREIILFPQFMALSGVVKTLHGTPGFSVGAQDTYPALEGAFTGEISPQMLKDEHVGWVLAGHSERRHVLGETDAFVGKKTAFALSQGLRVMLCIGETLEEREAGQVDAVLMRQLDAALADVPASVNAETLAVAYEPVWAIGTGKVAQLEDITSAHALVRKLLVRRFPGFGAQLPVLYGGSVKPENARSIILLDNVDGVLVGGASLAAESFSRIIFCLSPQQPATPVAAN